VFKQIHSFYKFIFFEKLWESEMKHTNKKRRLFEDDEIFGTTDVLGISKVPKDAAKAAIGGGKKDGDAGDDVASGKKASVPASALKAAQTEIIPEKALGMAIGMINKVGPFSGGPGGDLESIISSDNYIMDGHHRWAATFLADPGASITATQIDLPGKALVSALNVVTVGQFGRSGNAGKGNIAGFKVGVFDKLIDEWMEKGYTDDKGNATKPEDVKQAMETLGGGDFEAGKKIVMQNADKLPKDIMPGAPARVEMPVINGKEVADVAKAIAAGEIDIKSPYSDDVKAKMESYYQVRTGKKKLTETTMKILRYYNKKNQKRLQESYLKQVKKQKLEEKLTEFIKPMVLETLKKMIKIKK
jgi:hypothetical protein